MDVTQGTRKGRDVRTYQADLIAEVEAEHMPPVGTPLHHPRISIVAADRSTNTITAGYITYASNIVMAHADACATFEELLQANLPKGCYWITRVNVREVKPAPTER